VLIEAPAITLIRREENRRRRRTADPSSYDGTMKAASRTSTVTFLVSDVEGSTRLVQEVGPAAFTRIVERHNEILRAAF
jgi:class 3 adenylate cyclase